MKNVKIPFIISNFLHRGLFLSLLLSFMLLSCKGDDPVVSTDPVASFQFEVDADNFTEVVFTNVSQNATSYSWDFGDGSGTSTEENPTYTYSASGSYDVVLTATSSDNKTDTQTKAVAITDPDEALTLLAGAESKTWKLHRVGVSMSVGPDEASKGIWFGLQNDGSRNCVYEQTFTFERDGGYVFDDTGVFWGEFGVFNDRPIYETCFEATAANMINKDGVDVSAWLSGTHEYEYVPSTGALTLSGLGAWIGIPKLGTAGETTVPVSEVVCTITLSDSGTYDHMRVIFSYDGAAYWELNYASYDNASDEPALPADKVTASFDFTQDATDKKMITFTNTSVNATSYSWDFGDGTGMSTDENPTYTYTADGSFDVRLIAMSDASSDTVTKKITTSGPTQAAPTPTTAAADVISIFSDTYTSVGIDDINPNWGQSGSATTESIEGNDALKYTNLNYQGTVLTGSHDMSAMTHLHVDVWTEDQTAIRITPISAGASPVTEFPVEVGGINSGVWTSVDMPLSLFTGMTFQDIFQMKVDGGTGGTVYLDNIYFHKDPNGGGGGGATAPTEAAPAPTRAEADVVSVFSDTYTDLASTDFNPNWGQTTMVTTESIAGNDAFKYANFNYQGIQLAADNDLSAMTHLHVDVWTTDQTGIRVTPINQTGVTELPTLLPGVTAGAWISIDMPLSSFTGMTFESVHQLKFDGGTGGTVYLDNIYFY